MSENDKFLLKERNNSNGKLKLEPRKSKPNRSNYSFSTNYLPLSEQLILILKKNITIFLRNTKSLIAIFLSPVVFLLILVLLQFLSDNYTQGNIIKDHEVEFVDRTSVKCEFPLDCLSVGIAVIGRPSFNKIQDLSEIVNYLAEETELTLYKDVQYLPISKDNSTVNLDELYSYLVENANKTQYVVTFCYDHYKLGNVEVPCSPEHFYQEFFHLYTILYNITNSPNWFLSGGHLPMPHDLKLLHLKTAVDNSILRFHSKRKNLDYIPRIQNISTQGYPSVLNRFVKNSDVKSLFSVFYLFFPQTIVFCILLIELVRDKELNLKKYMILYGLSQTVYWVGWIIITSIICSAVAIEIVFIGRLLDFPVFINSNPIVPFLIFYLFGMTMGFLAFLLSSLIKYQSTANTVSYSIVLIGLVNQCVFQSYSLIYLLYSVNMKDIYKLIRYAFHFYPPFLFSKCFTDLARKSANHFDQTSLKWVEGDYFTIYHLFEKTVGKLRIGFYYEVDSCFETLLWFIFLSLLFIVVVCILETKEQYEDIKDFFASLLICRNPNENYTEINKKKHYLDTIINSIEVRPIEEKKTNKESKIKTEKNKTVINEKRLVIDNNRNSSIPSGLRILNLSKTYSSRDFKALDNLYLEINKDEILAILGPNGAGKSTMINMLTCQLSSNEGFAKLGPFFIRNEFTLDSMYVKRIVGVCSQFDYLWEELTVLEHLYLYSKLRGIKEDRITGYIKTKAEEVGLEKKLDSRISSLSGGMKRRLSICISTLGDPFVIFMDEPTTGLDPVNRRKIWSLIGKLKKNRVIILTTHLMEEADYLSDRIGIIIGGQLKFIGNSTELRNIYWDGIILVISKENNNEAFDISKVKNTEYLRDKLKEVFPNSEVAISNSGLCNIFILKENQQEMIKAFKLFKEKSVEELSEIKDFVKDISISQSNLENIFIEVYTVNISYVIYIRNERNYKKILF